MKPFFFFVFTLCSVMKVFKQWCKFLSVKFAFALVYSFLFKAARRREWSKCFKQLSLGFDVLKGGVSWKPSLNWCYQTSKRQWWIMYSPAFVFGININKANHTETLPVLIQLGSYLRDCDMHISIRTRIPNGQAPEFWSGNNTYQHFGRWL